MTKAKIAKLFGLLVVVVGIATCFFGSIGNEEKLVGLYQTFVEWMKNHMFLGALFFIAIHTLFTPVMFPFPVLKFAAGFAFSQCVDSMWLAIFYGTVCTYIGS